MRWRRSRSRGDDFTVFSGDATAYSGHDPAFVREPLRVTPRSNCELNPERLPAAARLRGMSLAFLEFPFPIATGRWPLVRALALLSIRGAIAALIAAVGMYAGVDYAEAAAEHSINWPLIAGATFIMFVVGVWHRFAAARRLPPVLLGASWTALIAATALLAGASLVEAPRTGELTMAAVIGTAVVFVVFGSSPTAFFYEWLYAHPQLTPETRARAPYRRLFGVSFRRLRVGPSYLALGGILLSLLFGAYAGAPSIPMVMTALLAAGPVLDQVLTGNRKPIGFFRDVLVRYRYYGLFASGAPGVWSPTTSLFERHRRLAALVGMLTAVLALGTSGFAPWDIPGLRPEASDATLRAWPLAWVWPAVTNKTAAVVLLAAPFVLGPALVVLALIAIYGPATNRLAALAWRIEEELDRYHTVPTDDGKSQVVMRPSPRTGEEEAVERSSWECFVDRIAGSTHVAPLPPAAGRTPDEKVREADHLFLGVEPYKRFPLLLALVLMFEHVYISGATGAAKTSIGVSSIILQLLRPRWHEERQLRRPPPMVIIDLKGDPLLFHTVREHVERTTWVEHGEVKRQRFRFFTLNPGYASDYFNPFQSLELGRRSLAQLCDLFLDSLELNNGRGYGRDYYREMTLTLLRAAVPELWEREASGEAVSLRTLAEIIAKRKPKSSEGFELGNFVQLLSRLKGLSEFEQLVTTQPLDAEGADHTIHMPRLLEENEVAYFWLDTTSQSVTAAGVAHLVLYALLTAAATRPHDRGFVVIDEFQTVVGSGFAPLLQMARGKAGLSFILASQTFSQLRNPDGLDFSRETEALTNVKLFFSVDSADYETLQTLSGEEVVRMPTTAVQRGLNLTRSSGPGGAGSSLSDQQQFGVTEPPTIRPRLGPNDFAAINSDIRRFLVYPRRNEGYTQYGGFPFLAETTWPITSAEFERLGGLTFPERQEGVWPTPAPGQPIATTAPAAVDRRMEQTADEVLRALDAQLDTLPPTRPPRGTTRKPRPRGRS